MNYLAHLYLSGSNPKVKVGNFIGDYVKGRDYTRYSPGIRKGILLHRRIDDFTDKHFLFKESSAIFRELYGHYSGIVTDVVYDHLLAANWERYSDKTLHKFVSEAHRILIMHYFSLPNGVKQFIPFLIKSRRMELYKDVDGLAKTLSIMSNYSSLPPHSDWAIEQLTKNRDALQENFFMFFEDIKEMCLVQLNVEN